MANKRIKENLAGKNTHEIDFKYEPTLVVGFHWMAFIWYIEG